MNGQHPETSVIPAGKEQAFRAWVKRNRISDLDAPDAFYDYRGAFLAGVDRGSDGHWPDTFKQHGHPTFSVESKYAIPNDSQAGRWENGRYVAPMTTPQPQFNPADVWEALIRKGISKAEATRHVLRQVANQPDAVRTQYLKDIDPGQLAALGLGAADMMSFGLGDQVARAVETVPIIGAGEGGARMTQEQAFGQHKTAYRVGQGLGLVGPAAAEIGLTKLGRLAPSAARLAVNAVRNKGGRIAAKAALNALEGGAYVGAQAAGHTEGGLGARGKAAVRAAPYGAVAGLALPAAGAALKAVRVPYVSRFFDYLAGEAPAAKPAVRPIPGLLGVGEELGAVTPRPSLVPSRAPAPDLLETPTYQRRAKPAAAAGMEGSPFILTEAEQAATIGAKTLRARAREAARTAYNLAIAAGQSVTQAKAAAQRAAGMAAGPPGLLAP